MHINGEWTKLLQTLLTYNEIILKRNHSNRPQPNNRIYESFGIFCPSDRLECIDLLRGEDILIDWMLPLYLNFTHVAIMEQIEAFYQTIGTVENLIGDIYVCDEPPGESEDGSLKESEVEMRPLALENVKAIHDLYPASEIECLEVFEKLVTSLPGFGIFCVETGTLAAWMVQSYYGAMCSMQTRPEYRRKGYGMQLARALTNLVLKRGYRPFVVIRPENDASKSLYIKLGFRKAFSTIRAIMKPYAKPFNGDGGYQLVGEKTENGEEEEVKAWSVKTGNGIKSSNIQD